MNRYTEESFQKRTDNVIIHDTIKTYISNEKGETEAILKSKRGFGVLRIELGKTNLIFKIEDLKKIIGDEIKE